MEKNFRLEIQFFTIVGMKICPVNREWIHTYLMEPFLQGVEMINRAWKGVDFHSLTKRPLSLKERVISWLVGMALLLPLINCIIWISWQTFGQPEKFFDPYCPEIETPPPTPAMIFHPQVNAQPVLAAPPGQGKPAEQFAYQETGKDFITRTNWKIEHHPNLIVAQEHCDEYSATSIYRPNRTISEFHHQNGEGTFDIWLTDPKHVRARIVKNGNEPIDKMLELTEAIPWIQQPTIGFKNFISSNDAEMSFYTVLSKAPFKFNLFAEKPPLIMKINAKKVGIEEVLGHGKLMKIEAVSTLGWLHNSKKSEMWFDPVTGILRKLIDSGLIIKKSVEFQNHP